MVQTAQALIGEFPAKYHPIAEIKRARQLHQCALERTLTHNHEPSGGLHHGPNEIVEAFVVDEPAYAEDQSFTVLRANLLDRTLIRRRKVILGDAERDHMATVP